jgi:hypothetical protein
MAAMQAVPNPTTLVKGEKQMRKWSKKLLPVAYYVGTLLTLVLAGVAGSKWH